MEGQEEVVMADSEAVYLSMEQLQDTELLQRLAGEDGVVYITEDETGYTLSVQNNQTRDDQPQEVQFEQTEEVQYEQAQEVVQYEQQPQEVQYEQQEVVTTPAENNYVYATEETAAVPVEHEYEVDDVKDEVHSHDQHNAQIIQRLQDEVGLNYEVATTAEQYVEAGQVINYETAQEQNDEQVQYVIMPEPEAPKPESKWVSILKPMQQPADEEPKPENDVHIEYVYANPEDAEQQETVVEQEDGSVLQIPSSAHEQQTVYVEQPQEIQTQSVESPHHVIEQQVVMDTTPLVKEVPAAAPIKQAPPIQRKSESILNQYLLQSDKPANHKPVVPQKTAAVAPSMFASNKIKFITDSKNTYLVVSEEGIPSSVVQTGDNKNSVASISSDENFVKYVQMVNQAAASPARSSKTMTNASSKARPTAMSRPPVISASSSSSSSSFKPAALSLTSPALHIIPPKPRIVTSHAPSPRPAAAESVKTRGRPRNTFATEYLSPVSTPAARRPARCLTCHVDFQTLPNFTNISEPRCLKCEINWRREHGGSNNREAGGGDSEPPTKIQKITTGGGGEGEELVGPISATYPCTRCPKRFWTQEALNKHEQKRHFNIATPAVVEVAEPEPAAPQMGGENTEMSDTTRNTPRVSRHPPRPRKSYKCYEHKEMTITNIVEQQKHTLQYHPQHYSGFPSVECLFCKENFGDVRELLTHLDEHDPECTGCDNVFESEGAMGAHSCKLQALRDSFTTAEAKPPQQQEQQQEEEEDFRGYFCEHCPKLFCTQEFLNIHVQNSHTSSDS